MSDNSWHPWGIPLIVIVVIVIILLILCKVRTHIRGPMYKKDTRMDGKTVVITGGNTGIGKMTAMDLAKRGANVTILCRDLARAKAAVDDIKNDSGCDVSYAKCDLASLQSIRECVAELKQKEPKIHVLINNAGIMMCPQWETEDGFEMQFGTNHIGHFYLTYLLLDNLRAAAPSRVVTVSSMGHNLPGTQMFWDDIHMKNSYDSVAAYGRSKLANILFTKSLAKKYKDDGINAYALHPGVINTELARHVEERFGCCYKCMGAIMRPFMKTPTLGAQTSIYCAVDEDLVNQTGLYYADCREKIPYSPARNEADAERLWKLSLELVGLKEEDTKVEDIKE